MIYKWATHLQTKKYLFQLMEQVLVSEKSFKLKLKQKEIIPTSFNAPGNWEKYLEVLVELSPWKKPCLVCGAPMMQGNSVLKRKSDPFEYGCVAFKVHSLLLPINMVILETALGQKCDHELYQAECHECFPKVAQANVLQTLRIQQEVYGPFQTYEGER